MSRTVEAKMAESSSTLRCQHTTGEYREHVVHPNGRDIGPGWDFTTCGAPVRYQIAWATVETGRRDQHLRRHSRFVCASHAAAFARDHAQLLGQVPSA